MTVVKDWKHHTVWAGRWWFGQGGGRGDEAGAGVREVALRHRGALCAADGPHARQRLLRREGH